MILLVVVVDTQTSFPSLTLHVSLVSLLSCSSILKYTPHAPQEYGSIECFGKNDVGLQQKSCKYQIIPSGKSCFLPDNVIKLWTESEK